MRTTKMRFKWNFLNLLFFVPYIIKTINISDKAYFDE